MWIKIIHKISISFLFWEIWAFFRLQLINYAFIGIRPNVIFICKVNNEQCKFNFSSRHKISTLYANECECNAICVFFCFCRSMWKIEINKKNRTRFALVHINFQFPFHVHCATEHKNGLKTSAAVNIYPQFNNL